jgi:hypothetical protein
VSFIARWNAIVASRPCRAARAVSELGSSAEHQPPLRPEAPYPAICRSSTTIRSDGSRAAR